MPTQLLGQDLGLDHDGLIPAFLAVTAGKVGDQTQARAFEFPRGSVVVFDKGYASYEWHQSLSGQGVSYVTRMRGNAKLRYWQPVRWLLTVAY